MKTNLWALWCFFLFGASLSFAQTTAIPDANFEQSLINRGIDSDGVINGQVLTADISGLLTFVVNGAGINDFTGLEDFSSLVVLDITNNTVGNLDLRNSPDLEEFTCFGCNPTSIDITQNTKLTDLTILTTSLSSIDVSNNTALTTIDVRNSQLTSLDASNLNSLETLRILNNQLNTISFPSSGSLRTVVLDNNNLTFIDFKTFIVNNPLIDDFFARENSFTSIDFNTGSSTQISGNYNLRINPIENLDIKNTTFNGNLVLTTIPTLFCISIDDPNNPPSTIITDSQVFFSASCNVNIPDSNFEQALIDANIDTDGTINQQVFAGDVRNVQALSLDNKNVSDLTGIEAFLALEELFMSNNPSLTSADLSSNTNLTELRAISTGLTGAPLLGANTNLQQMTINSGNFSSIDLSGLTGLVSVSLQSNGLNTITLNNHPNLAELNVRQNGVSTINVTGSPLLSVLQMDFTSMIAIDLSQNPLLTTIRAQATQLRELDFSGNPILANAIIDNNPLLAYVDLRNDDRTDLNTLSVGSNRSPMCVALDNLNLINNSWNIDSQSYYSTGCFTLIPDANFEQELITQNIDSDGVINGRVFTSDIETLTALSIGNLAVADFTGIEDFTALQTFQVGGPGSGPVTSLDLSNNAQLTTINATFPQLTSLDLTGCTLLRFISLTVDLLPSLDLSQNIALEDVRIYDSNIQSLDLTNLINLDQLELPRNQLTQLDISQNSNLRLVQVIDNQITAIDVSQNSSLLVLGAENNNLSSISVRTGNGTNDLQSLNVRGNINLECIEVDDENNIPSGWNKDATASYSESCGPRPVFLNPPTEISEAYTATIEFDRVVSGFELSDITISGGTLSNFQSVSGAEYTVLVTPTSVCSSSLTLEVAANVAEDTQNKQNSASGVLTINTIDEESPAVLLQDITISLNASGDATITGAAIDNGSNDNCTLAADLSFSLSQFLFTCNDLGANTISVLVDDAAGNTQAGSVTVTVVDELNPSAITQDITVQLDASGNISVSSQDIDNGSLDNCAIANLSLDKTDFTCADVGQNTVTLTVTDASGNTDNATAVVTVEEDPNQPLTAIAQDITVQLDASGQITITPGDIDNGSGSGCSNITLSLDITDFDCSNIGQNTVTLTVTEGSNAETATATVTVEDTLGPNLLLQDITIDIEADGTSTITVADLDNGTSDNCSSQGDITMSLDITSFDCTNLGANTVTVTATDGLGNISTGTATVTVQDVTAPIVVTQDITVALDADGNASISPSDIDNGSSDACSGIASITLDINEFNCPQLGGNVVNLTVTDNDGNTATAAATVTITATDDDTNGIADDCETKELVTPKGFSPNADGINDTWVVENIEDYPNAKVSVFNRWGIKVFEAVGYNNDWNGTSTEGGGSKQLPAGAYLYVIETNDTEFAPQQGWIYINY